MKFGYTIFFALVALIAVSGFASADRLPVQVPENQVFTIDTLVDATGSVSQESEMQWTIDSQEESLDGVYYNTGRYGNISEYGAQLYYNQTVALYVWAEQIAYEFGGDWTDYFDYYPSSHEEYYATISKLYVPDSVSHMYPDKASFGSSTFADIISDLSGAPMYVADDSKKLNIGIHDSMLKVGEEIAILTWTDSLRSNGGKLSLNENIDFDSRNKGKGLSNLEVEKVLTYASTEGAHLVGAEEWTLDVAGSWQKTANTIRCVFAESSSEDFPAFCNVVKAKSELININSAQVSTKGSARSVAATGDIPAALAYQIAVTPDSNSGSGFADGTVKTLFGGSIMEARGTCELCITSDLTATNNWKDTASATGGIKNFQKTFNYESGFTI